MKYLVLYTSDNYLGYVDGRALYSTSTKFEELDTKEEAIEFARKQKGVIVESFEWDIKKTAPTKSGGQDK